MEYEHLPDVSGVNETGLPGNFQTIELPITERLQTFGWKYISI